MLEATAIAEDRHFWFKSLRRNARRLLCDALGGQRPQLIVDCGAGTGRNLDWLSTLGPAVGIERSAVGLREGRARHRRLVQGTVTQLPLPNACADVATSFDVLYCLDDESERAALAEMWRVLRPGGVLMVNVAALEILHGSHSTLTHEVRRYTKNRLRPALTNAGFVVERLTFTNMMTFPLTLAVRLSERIRGKAGEASDADLRVPPAPVNAALDLALRFEFAFLRRMNLPIGTSLMAVARKPRGDIRDTHR